MKILHTVKSYLPEVKLVEKEQCHTAGKTYGFVAGDMIHKGLTKTCTGIKNAVPYVKKAGAATLVFLATLGIKGKNLATRVAIFASIVLREIGTTPTGTRIRNGVSYLHLSDKCNKVKRAASFLFGKMKLLANKTIVTLYTKVLTPLAKSALQAIRTYKGPVFRSIKNNTIRLALFTHINVIKPAAQLIAKLTRRVANFIIVKTAPAVYVLRNRVITPVMNKVINPMKDTIVDPIVNHVIKPTYRFSKDLAIGTVSGFVNHSKPHYS